jgi:DNA-binding XRE family transcriptional regulator
LRTPEAWLQAKLTIQLGVLRQTVNASLPPAIQVARRFKKPIEEIFESNGDKN